MRTETLKDEVYRFLGAAFEIYKERTYGLVEEVHQECTEIKLQMRIIPFGPKEEIN